MRTPPRSPLGVCLEQQILDVLHSERFVDASPYEVYFALLDEKQYLCSIRSMYRLLEKHQEVQERRHQRRTPKYQKPELLATGPRQVWSWDITRLKGPVKGTSYHLYVILDIYSRYVPGWMVASRECGELARRFIEETLQKERIARDQLILHSDRGVSMTSRTVSQLLADLGVDKSFNRPYHSNDNPYSESQFKTLKYRPVFPERFGSIQDARSHCRDFFPWYNESHYHSGIAFLTPGMVHREEAARVLSERQAVLDNAYAAIPGRFGSRPFVGELPAEVWINAPARSEVKKEKEGSV